MPICSSLSFTVGVLREQGILAGRCGSGQLSWSSSRTKKRIGSIGLTADESGITIFYTWTPYGGEPQQMQDRIDWIWLRVGFGQRAYFQCPSCGRRCGRIIFSGGRWVCKKCAGACSDTENDRPYYRLMAGYNR